MVNFSFPKSERLTNKKKFAKLFEQGISINKYPLKLIYIIEEDKSDSCTFQIAFTVPKRRFKRAVDRNFLKRRMREAYRLNKPKFINSANPPLIACYGIVIYIGKEKQEFKDIQKAWSKLESKFSQRIEK